MQNELEYVRNKKSFSPIEPIVVIKKTMACANNKLKNPYMVFSQNKIIHAERIAYTAQKQAVTNLLYLCL